MPTLLRNASFVIEHYVAQAFVRLARTSEALPKHAQVVAALDACRAALGARDTSQLAILVDWRLAPLPPPGTEAERDVVAEVEKFGAPFARRALLLLSAAGDTAEQAQSGYERAAKAWAATQYRVFFDEEQAIAFVTGG